MLIVILIVAIIGVGIYLYKNEEARKKFINFFTSIWETISTSVKGVKGGSIRLIAIVLMVVGIILICVGINSYHYAKSHTWGDPGSISDRNNKAPYMEKFKNSCTAGGIITFAGVIIYFTKGKNTVIVSDTSKKANKESCNNNDNIKKLEELKKLVDNGTITQEDYDKKKKDLLNKI